ncbi:hypothetical protein COU76_02565 [Candidatus Peregrinibacteria bacterium CG10_big_fil_rev_8_21_14_0_10_49_10]|nr:MAG: hypothetical protein COU76_02565 [Candidatus Peregrinibacteria bacterium CG10_big_fil_rev_8_21_14_0_10_49_10]
MSPRSLEAVPFTDRSTSNQIVTLPGGETGYSLAGQLDPEEAKHITIINHGLPNSRWCIGPAHNMAKEEGVMMLCPERPGFGNTPYRTTMNTILDYPKDIEALIHEIRSGNLREHINPDIPISMIGVSGGAPATVACAHELPEDALNKIVVVNGMGPYGMEDSTRGMPWYQKLLFWNANHDKFLPLRPLNFAFRWANLAGLKVVQKLTQWFPQWAVKKMPHGNAYDTDVAVAYRQMLHKDALEATKQGIRGLAREIVKISNDWGFDPANIKTGNRVHIFSATEDTSVPPANATNILRAIGDPKKATHQQEAGYDHLMVFSIMPLILDDICGLGLEDLIEEEKDLITTLRDFNGGLASEEDFQRAVEAARAVERRRN